MMSLFVSVRLHHFFPTLPLSVPATSGTTVSGGVDGMLVSATALCESHLSSRPWRSASHTWSSLHREMSRQLPRTHSFSFLFGSNVAYSGPRARAPGIQSNRGFSGANTHLYNWSQYKEGDYPTLRISANTDSFQKGKRMLAKNGSFHCQSTSRQDLGCTCSHRTTPTWSGTVV